MKRPFAHSEVGEGGEQHFRAVKVRAGEYSPSAQYPAEEWAALFVHAHVGDLVVDVSEKLSARACVSVSLFVFAASPSCGSASCR
jgi:hypothetical protein